MSFSTVVLFLTSINKCFLLSYIKFLLGKIIRCGIHLLNSNMIFFFDILENVMFDMVQN